MSQYRFQSLFAALVICATSWCLPSVRAQPPEFTVRKDRYNDAMPLGIERRFGTLRFRHADGHKRIQDLCFSADGHALASVGPDHTVRVWDLEGRELARLEGDETQGFSCVAFSPDGAKIAAAGDRGGIVWDAWASPASSSTGIGFEDLTKGKRRFQTRGYVNGLQYSENSEQLGATQMFFTPMAGFRKRQFQIWDLKAGNAVGSLDVSEGMIWPMAISMADGLAACRDGNRVLVRKLATGETVSTYKGHSHDLFSVAFQPRGNLVASASVHEGELQIHCWDRRTGVRRHLAQRKTKFSTYRVAFSPDGQMLLGAATSRDLDGGYADGRIAVDTPSVVELHRWTPNGLRLLHAFEGYGAPAVSADGQRLAAARFNRIQLFSVATGEPLHAHVGHDAQVLSVAISRDGKRCASAARDRTIRYWDMRSGRQIRKRTIEDGIGNASFSNDLKRVAVLHGELESNDRRKVTVWQDDRNPPLLDLDMPNGGRLAAISGDGKSLATWGEHDLRVWDIESAKLKAKMAPPSYPIVISHLALSRDGRFVVTGCMSEPIRVWDVSKAEQSLVLEPGAEQMGRSFGGPFTLSHDDKLLATRLDNTIVLYDLGTGRRIDAMPRQTSGYVAELSISPNGRLLAASARDNSVRLLSVETGKVLADFGLPARGWSSIEFAPDGKRLLSGGGNTTLELWNVQALINASRQP